MGLIYKFSLEYADKRRPELKKININYIDLINYLDKHNTFEEFIQFASKNGVKRVNKEIEISEKILKTQLYAYIARNISGDAEFFHILNGIDNTLETAIETLQSQSE